MFGKQTVQEQTLTLPEALQRALALHQQGRLDQSEHLYLQILEAEHDHFDARHLLGVLRYQQGRNEEALELIGAALAIRPNSPEALSNYGVVLQQSKRHEDALGSFEKALAIRPDYAEALNNRGNALLELKRYQDALASYDKALAVTPDYADALFGRGIALNEIKRNEEVQGQQGTNLDECAAEVSKSANLDAKNSVSSESLRPVHDPSILEVLLSAKHLDRDGAAEHNAWLPHNFAEKNLDSANKDRISTDQRLSTLPTGDLRLPAAAQLQDLDPPTQEALSSAKHGNREGAIESRHNIRPFGNLAEERLVRADENVAEADQRGGHLKGERLGAEGSEEDWHLKELTEPGWREDPNGSVHDLLRPRMQLLAPRVLTRLVLGIALVVAALLVVWNLGSRPAVQALKALESRVSGPGIRGATDEQLSAGKQPTNPTSVGTASPEMLRTVSPELSAVDTEAADKGTPEPPTVESAGAGTPAAGMESDQPIATVSATTEPPANKILKTETQTAEPATGATLGIGASEPKPLQADQEVSEKSMIPPASETPVETRAEPVSEEPPVGRTSTEVAALGVASPATTGTEEAAGENSSTHAPSVGKPIVEAKPIGMAPQEMTTAKAAGPETAGTSASEPKSSQTRGYAFRKLGADEVAMLVMRGEEFIGVGDIPSARLVLQRAAEAGDARAALVIGGTYDPLMPEKLKVRGFAPDIAMARTWYERAKEFGSTEASRRLEMLARQGR